MRYLKRSTRKPWPRFAVAVCGVAAATAVAVGALAVQGTARSARASAAVAGGYPDGHYPSPLRMGMWDHFLIGAFQPVGSDQLSTATYWGLRHTNTWNDLYVRTSTGTLYVVAHQLMQAQPGDPLTAAPAVALQSSPQGFVPDTCDRPWAGTATETLTADDSVQRTVAEANGQQETVVFGPRRFEWKSADPNYIDVTGTLVTPGTQFLLPWRDPTGSTDEMYYLAQYYEVHGTYCGHRIIDGHAQIENVWGNVSYQNTWWVNNRIGHWTTWTNTYSDGTKETGQFLCGEYGARGAVIVNNKGRVVLDTTQINAVDEGNRIVYRFGNGSEWEFLKDPPSSASFGSTQIANGLVKRVGDNRKIVRHSATYLISQRMCTPEPLHG